MKKLYWVISGKHRIFEKRKLSYRKHKCTNDDEKIFKEEESIEILNLLGLFKNIL